RPFNTIDPSVEWQRTIKVEQDIDMDKIGAMARKNQPGIIVVDRTVPGKWENYVTPEQSIPEQPLGIPWESCITMGNSFSYVPNDQYKPAKTIVETLVKIISRGGNYLLNIAPGPNGDFDQEAYDRLEELASWMNINESAVFATRAVATYHKGDYYYTRSKDQKVVNVFHRSEGSKYQQPTQFKFPLPSGFVPTEVKVLGYTGELQWTNENNEIVIDSPNIKLQYAGVI